MTETTTQKSATKRPRRMAREPKPHQDVNSPGEASSAGSKAHAKTATSQKGPSKNEWVLSLLGRSEGATLDQMVAVTGWLPHTTRAVLTGFRRNGRSITSEKIDGVRTYRIAQSDGEQATAKAGEHFRAKTAAEV